MILHTHPSGFEPETSNPKWETREVTQGTTLVLDLLYLNLHSGTWILVMGRHIGTSCNPTPPFNKEYLICDDKGEGPSTKQGPLAVQSSESSRNAKRFSVNVGSDNISEDENTWRCRKRISEVTFDALQSAKRAATETRIDVGNELPTVNREKFAIPLFINLRKTRLEQQPIPDLNLKMESIIPTETDLVIFSRLPHPTMTPNSNAVDTSKEYCAQAETTTLNPRRLECYKSFENKSFPVSKSFQDNFAGSTRFSPLEHENCNYGSYSMHLRSDTVINRGIIAPNSGSPVRKMDRDFRYLNLVGEEGQGVSDFSFAGLLPIQSHTPGLTKLEDSRHVYDSSNRNASCCHPDIETVQMCTNVDSVAKVSGGLPKFSKTTHHFLITKKKDAKFSKIREQMVRKSTVSNAVIGNSFHGMLTLPPVFGANVGEEGKLRLSSKSTDCEGKEEGCAIRKDFRETLNESLADTDTLSVNIYQSRNLPTGGTSSPSVKDITVGSNPVAAASSGRSIGMRSPKSVFPVINDALPADESAADSLDNRAVSTSKTESLDVENLLSHVKQQPEDSISSPQPESLPAPQLSNRWIKRLKRSPSASHALGTKSWTLEDDSHGGNVNKLFNRLISFQKTSTEVALKNLRKEPLLLDRAMFLSSRESSSEESAKDNSVSSCLSNPWIKRWNCREYAAKARSSFQTCEQESSNAALKHVLHRKQFPSLAAMALMKKAVVNLQPCEFRNRGSFVVWNT